jgi:hypothetical protein
MILLISASSVVRITDVSHQCPACLAFLSWQPKQIKTLVKICAVKVRNWHICPNRVLKGGNRMAER